MNLRKSVFVLVAILFLVEIGFSAQPDGYYRFDSNLADSSTNTNTGTIKGSSLYFDGENDWVDVNITDSPDWEYTIAAWIKPQDKTDRMIFRRAHCDALFFTDSSLKLYIKRSDHASGAITIPNTHINENQWNFVAATTNLNQSSAKIYVNGNTETKTIDLNNSADLMSGGGREDFIGGGSSINSCPTPGFYQGWIDNTYFYDRSLSFAELDLLYEGGHIEKSLIGFWPMSDQSGLSVTDYSGSNYTGKIVQGKNLLNNSGFESGSDGTGNMDRIHTNYAGDSWVSNYSIFGEYSGRHNKTGEDDQWSAVEWIVSSINTSTEYVFSSWYKCSGNVSSQNTEMKIRIYNGTGWHLEDSTTLDYDCTGRWNKTTGRVGKGVTTLQDQNHIRHQWSYSTNSGQMYVDNISLRVDGPEWSKQGYQTAQTVYSSGILGTEAVDFTGFDNYAQFSDPGLNGAFTVSAWIKASGSKIGTRSNPGKSCSHILKNGGSTGNGKYWINPDGSQEKFQVYCDMKTDGGGWTLVGTYADGSFFKDCSGSNVDLEYGGGCSTVCSEFTDDGDHCDNATEKSIQDSEMKKLEDKYVIEKEYGSLQTRSTSDYVSPAYYSLEFEDTMFNDEYGNFISYNFSNPTVNKGNLNYTLKSMSDFYRSANTHHLQLIFKSYNSNMEPSQANQCGDFKLGIMSADADGSDPDDYYKTDRKYLRYSAARAGPIWDSANNGGCGFDDAQGRWTQKRLGGQQNDQSQYIAWYVRDSTVRNAGIAQGEYGINTGKNRLTTGIEKQNSQKTTPGWHHVALVYDNTTDLQKTYLDGQKISEQTDLGPQDALTQLYVGKYFNGKVDEVRVYDRPLPQNEINMLAFRG